MNDHRAAGAALLGAHARPRLSACAGPLRGAAESAAAAAVSKHLDTEPAASADATHGDLWNQMWAHLDARRMRRLPGGRAARQACFAVVRPWHRTGSRIDDLRPCIAHSGIAVDPQQPWLRGALMACNRDGVCVGVMPAGRLYSMCFLPRWSAGWKWFHAQREGSAVL